MGSSVPEQVRIQRGPDDVVVGDLQGDFDDVHAGHCGQQVGGGVDPVDPAVRAVGGAGVDGAAKHGRTADYLNDFTSKLLAVAPRSSVTTGWLEHRNAAM
jgi:hypothetical protein